MANGFVHAAELRRRLVSVGIAVSVVACTPSMTPESPTSSPVAIPSPGVSPSGVAPTAAQPSALGTGTPTDPLDTEGKTIDWAVYRSVAFGIEFEYPRSSASRGLLPKCAPSESTEGISLDRLFIAASYERSLPATVSPATADAAADAFISGSPITDVVRTPATVAGRAAVHLGYRFGGLSRYGDVTFVAARGHIYAFAWDAGVNDCMATNGFGGPQVYAHVVATVRFLS